MEPSWEGTWWIAPVELGTMRVRHLYSLLNQSGLTAYVLFV